jgi:two-component system NarL family response regulator
MVIEAHEDLTVVGEAGDGEEALRQVAALAPDVVLMDVRMPGIGGIEATRRVAIDVPSARIVMLTVSDEDQDLYEAVKAGAVGYLLKEVSIEEVADAVRTVVTGQSLISPSMASKLLNEFSALARRVDDRAVPAGPRLTERETDVLKLLARGLSNRVIADRLDIAENTAKNHVRSILEKLQLHSRTEAALYAVRERLVDGA